MSVEIDLKPAAPVKTVLKRLLWSCIVASIIFWFPACSKKQTISILDDISRDTYENNLIKQREKNIGKPNYEEPQTYDQYQRERKELLPDNKVTLPNVKQK